MKTFFCRHTWRGRMAFAALLITLSMVSATAQSTAFRYRGQLTDGWASASGSYDLQFSLFDLQNDGTQQGTTITLSNVSVDNGSFTVQLDFGSDVFTGVTGRFLQIAVGSGGSNETFTTLSSRVLITSTPYAIRTISAGTADTASTAVNAMQLGGLDPAQYVLTTDTRLSDSRTPAPGSVNYIQNGSTQQTGTTFNIDGDGTIGGTVSGNAVNSATGYNIGGTTVFSILANSSTFAGLSVGTSGTANSFFGASAGQQNSGTGNSFFGNLAAANNTTGNNNTFLGFMAGQNNTTGSLNTFIGAGAGPANGATNLVQSTAIGANAQVSTSNTIVLGTTAESVQVPGSLSVTGSINGSINGTSTNATQLGGVPAAQYVLTGDSRLSDSRTPAPGSVNYIQNGSTQQTGTTFNIDGDGTIGGTVSGNAVNSATGYSIGGSTVFSILANSSTFAGLSVGTSGTANSFFGASAGQQNSGTGNSFFGNLAAANNTTGNNNTFLGFMAGQNNTTGSLNTFIGASAGPANSATNLVQSTAIGANAQVSTSNTIVLGTTAESVQVPGSLSVTGSINGSINGTSTNATQLGGIPAGQYVLTGDSRLSDSRTPVPGSVNYIQNRSSVQTSTSFNIDGNGTAGGTLSGNAVNSTTGYNIAGNSVMSFLSSSNTVVLGTSSQTVQVAGSLTSGNASFKGIVASLLTKADGSFANTSIYGANTSITTDFPNWQVHLQPCCQQITLVGNGTSARMSESTVVGYSASATNSSYTDNCGIDVDCTFGGPPVIVGAFASGMGTSLGYKSFTNNSEAVAVGPQSRAIGPASFALGDKAEALSPGFNGNELVIGDAIRATGNGVIAIGGGGSYTHNSVISFGYSSVLGQSGVSASFANQQMMVGGSMDGNTVFGIKDIYFGNGDVARYADWKNSIPVDVSINITGAAGVDQNGKNLRLRSGRGTGVGTPGNFIVSTPFAGTTGSVSHSYIDRLQIDGLGNLTLLQGTRLQLQGSSTGTATISVPANAGTPNLTIPSQSGTFTVLGNTTTGNGTMIATGSGLYTPGNCVMVDGNGNLVDSGAPCGVSGPNVMSTNSAVVTNSTRLQQDEVTRKQSQINEMNLQIQTLRQQVEDLKKLICAEHPDANMCKQQ